MGERFAFNINAELYENKFGELAIKFTGEKVYAEVGTDWTSNLMRWDRKPAPTSEKSSTNLDS